MEDKIRSLRSNEDLRAGKYFQKRWATYVQVRWGHSISKDK